MREYSRAARRLKILPSREQPQKCIGVSINAKVAGRSKTHCCCRGMHQQSHRDSFIHVIQHPDAAGGLRDGDRDPSLGDG